MDGPESGTGGDGHFHRGRRGSDRRGIDRRDRSRRSRRSAGGGNQVDVEQIMRDIRGRIAQRQGIELSNQQIQDLAARRLESILDPRAIKPSLLDALRREAPGRPGTARRREVPNEPAFSFEDTTIYDSHRGLMRFIRRLLNPLLKLFFNPNPLIRALHIQAQAQRRSGGARCRARPAADGVERAALRDRPAARDRGVAGELELQALSLRVESLDAKVDFNERRVRGIEGIRAPGRVPQSGPGGPRLNHPAVSAPLPSRRRTGSRRSHDAAPRPAPKDRRRRRARAADAAAAADAVPGWDRARVSRWAPVTAAPSRGLRRVDENGR